MPTPATTQYEIMAILPGSLKKADAEAAHTKLTTEVEKLGPIAHHTQWPGKQLAYPIRGETVGHYHIFVLSQAKKQALTEFNETMRVDPHILRHIVIKLPRDYQWRQYTAQDLEWDYQKILQEEKAQKAPKKPARPPSRAACGRPRPTKPSS